MRFIQLDYNHIKIQLVKNGVDATKEQIEQYIEEKLDDLIKKDNIIYIFEWMSEIPLDSNNKIKFMISNALDDCDKRIDSVPKVGVI
jgi:hypothetical protein